MEEDIRKYGFKDFSNCTTIDVAKDNTNIYYRLLHKC